MCDNSVLLKVQWLFQALSYIFCWIFILNYIRPAVKETAIIRNIVVDFTINDKCSTREGKYSLI